VRTAPVLLSECMDSSFFSSFIGEVWAPGLAGTKNFLMDYQVEGCPLREGPSSLFGLVLAASDLLFSSTI
jgi:hypothetical protein